MSAILRKFLNALTIQKKITIGLILVVLLCFSSSIWIQFHSTRRQLLSISREDAQLKTNMLGVAIRSGVAAHDGGTIERTLDLSNDASHHIATAIVLHADGTELVNFHHTLWQPYSLAGRSAELQAVFKSGDATVTESDHDILVVIPIRNQGNRIIGVLAVAWDLTQQYQAMQTVARNDFFAAGVTVIVLLAGLNGLLWRVAVAPLRTIVDVMDSLAKGQIDVDVPHQDRADEIGRMAAAIRIFQANALSVRRLESERAAQEENAAVAKRQAIAELSSRFRASVQSSVATFSASAGHMIDMAQTMSAFSAQTGGESEAAHASAAEALCQCELVADAASQAAAAIAEVGRRAEEASRVTGIVVENTRKTDAAMQSLQQAAGKVGDVVATINKIASLTNLLALNATIEAAHAGEMGKGFAVVATEVKQLAHQTSRATEQISDQVLAISHATDEAAVAIAAVNRSINSIGQSANEIAAAVEEHTAVASEVAVSIDRVVSTNTDVAHRAKNVTTVAEKNGSAASQVLLMAETFAKKANELSDVVDDFLQSMEQERA